MDTKQFILEAHTSLLRLAIGNLAIGLKEQPIMGERLGCMYGVGLGYYEAADAFRSMAIKSGLIAPDECPETMWKSSLLSAEEQARELAPLECAIVCPLDRALKEARSTSAEFHTPNKRKCHGSGVQSECNK